MHNIMFILCLDTGMISTTFWIYFHALAFSAEMRWFAGKYLLPQSATPQLRLYLYTAMPHTPNLHFYLEPRFSCIQIIWQKRLHPLATKLHGFESAGSRIHNRRVQVCSLKTISYTAQVQIGCQNYVVVFKMSPPHAPQIPWFWECCRQCSLSQSATLKFWSYTVHPLVQQYSFCCNMGCIFCPGSDKMSKQGETML